MTIRLLVTSLALLVVSALVSTAQLPPPGGEHVERPAALRFRDCYQRLVSADAARDRKDWIEALRLYQSARDEYIAVRAQYPDWDAATTRFRITYAANQVESLFDRLGQRSATDPIIKDTAARQRDVVFLVRTAKDLLRRGNHVKARALLLEGLRYDPDSWAIRMLLGIAQCQAGQFGDAAVIAQQLVREQPEDVASRMLLAGAWYGLARHAEAEAELSDVLKVRPDFAAAHLNLAQVLAYKDKPDETAARRHYRRALELGEEPDRDLGRRLRIKPPRR